MKFNITCLSIDTTNVLADTPLRSYALFHQQPKDYGNEKDVGVSSSRAYPHVQAFALPPSQG